MQRSRYAPEEHARRHPSYHAILPSQRSARGLQRDEESKEERYGCIQVALLEPDIGGEVRRLGISYLYHGYSQRRALVNRVLNSTNIRFVKGVEEEQKCKEGQ
jgi:hypothetical protein